VQREATRRDEIQARMARLEKARPSPDAAPDGRPWGKMMDKDIFKECERSLEEEYFREREAKLIEKLRERAKLDEIVEALGA
jgi:hypothetical protein